MAKFSFNGVDSISADFEQLSKVDEDTKYRILEAGAKILKEKMEEVIRRKELMDPVMPQLVNSIKIKRKKSKDEIFVRISPEGKRKDGKKTNNEVGYALELGTPRIPAKHWMETASEEAEENAYWAMESAWDEYLKKLNL